MTYKEFIKSDLCKKMVREEKEKERMLRAKNGENVKKLEQRKVRLFCLRLHWYQILLKRKLKEYFQYSFEKNLFSLQNMCVPPFQDLILAN